MWAAIGQRPRSGFSGAILVGESQKIIDHHRRAGARCGLRSNFAFTCTQADKVSAIKIVWQGAPISQVRSRAQASHSQENGNDGEPPDEVVRAVHHLAGIAHDAGISSSSWATNATECVR
jgi:hypothetical protein